MRARGMTPPLFVPLFVFLSLFCLPPLSAQSAGTFLHQHAPPPLHSRSAHVKDALVHAASLQSFQESLQDASSLLEMRDKEAVIVSSLVEIAERRIDDASAFLSEEEEEEEEEGEEDGEEEEEEDGEEEEYEGLTLEEEEAHHEALSSPVEHSLSSDPLSSEIYDDALSLSNDHSKHSFIQSASRLSNSALRQLEGKQRGFTDKTSQELFEQIKLEEGILKRRQRGEAELIQDELTERDSPLISDFKDSLREGGLEGSVGNVIYNTPDKLQDKIIEMSKSIDRAIDLFSPMDSFAVILRNLPPNMSPKTMLNKWQSSIPYIRFMREALMKACPPGNVEMAGDPEIADAFPRCYVDYIVSLDTKTKLDLGQRIRGVLQSPGEIDSLLNLKDGLCVPVSAVLNLGDRFCVDVLEVYRSVVEFLKVSTFVQTKEKEYYGEEAAMIAINQDMKEDLLARDAVDGAAIFLESSGKNFQQEINSMRGRMVFRQLKLTFERAWEKEAAHLRDVYFNDPVHKWRYSIWLFQFITTSGLWMSEEANLF